MSKAVLSGLIILALGLSACGSGSGSGNAHTTLQGAEGIWMQKDEADELRTTGKLQSMCPEVKKDPNSMIVNIRLIDKDGSTYMYNPNIGKIPQMKMGTLSSAGQLVLTQEFGKQFGSQAKIKVSVASDVLSFDFSGLKMDYLRSSEPEARKYFDAQAACKTSP